MPNSDPKIAVIGLGYVGLPLALEFSKVVPTVGFDINVARIGELADGHDSTLEASAEEMAAASDLVYTSDEAALADCNVYIVTVPTPVDEFKRPDLRPLLGASETVGRHLKKGDVVIYESTVYPGATEEDAVPVLERVSGLAFNRDFYAGYSPERINPGDKVHRLPDIVKVTSGSTPEIADFVDGLYGRIIRAGTHKANSIKITKTTKVIENTQRNVNIALVNELSLIFERMEIDTLDVLEAAGTKWNFLPFRPGLVGGHCIGVDPYYLTHKAAALGHFPEVVLAGRRINDGMGQHVVECLVKKMIAADRPVKGGRLLILGMTFKENCPDIRNSKVVDIVEHARSYHLNVDVYDPNVDAAELKREYGLDLAEPESGTYDAVVLAVGHEDFVQNGAADLRKYGKEGAVFFDLKGVFDKAESDFRL